MPDKKLTDEEIIKAYEFCLNNKDCIGCIADKNSKSGEFDCKLKPQDIIDVINRLQAENERLKEEISKLENKIDEIYPLVMQLPNAMQDIKAEAYKEFADMLKKHSYFEHRQVVAVELIDNLLKELAGDDNITKGNEG